MTSADDGPVAVLPDDDVQHLGGRVESRKARTRANLLAAARHLFAGRGVERTTIAEIAEHADVAIGSFYNYFSTKEELLDALLEEALSEQLRLLRLRQAQVSDPAEKISIAHRHLVRVARTDSDWARLLVRLEFPRRVAWSVLGDTAGRDLPTPRGNASRTSSHAQSESVRATRTRWRCAMLIFSAGSLTCSWRSRSTRSCSDWASSISASSNSSLVGK